LHKGRQKPSQCISSSTEIYAQLRQTQYILVRKKRRIRVKIVHWRILRGTHAGYLPLCISIDGSLDSQGVATTTITILAPDIRDDDSLDCNIWENRPAKALLIRSWWLPLKWGTGSTSINMAESIGFILGEYSITADVPILYITDSNNARALQKNLKHTINLTHRKLVWHIKQGIDYAIANHLEYLTNKWPCYEQLDYHAQRQIRNGETLCEIWVNQQNHQHDHREALQNSSNPDECYMARNYRLHMDDDTTSSLSSGRDSEEDSIGSVEQLDLALNRITCQSKKNRSRFDTSMFDVLERNIILKVYSHQLNADFSLKKTEKNPRPNLFITSANQIMDNAASQAREVIHTIPPFFNQVFYLAFSPQWCFTFECRVTNKGATTVLHEKIDDELYFRLLHRPKQGLFYRLLPFIGLNLEQIGNESLMHNVAKQTAPCWTRYTYRHPPTVNCIWKIWWSNLSSEEQENTPKDIPGGWQKIPTIANNIIKRCPFCNENNSQNEPKKPRTSTPLL